MDRSLSSAFLSIASAKLVTSLLSILSLPLVVRVLGAEGYGDYAFLLSVFSLLMILVSSGVTEGVQKFAAESRDREDWKQAVVGFYLKLAVVLAAVGALGVAVVAWSGIPARFLGGEFTLYFYLLAAFVVTAQLRSFTRRTLMGLGQERYSEPLRVVSKVVWLGLGLGLAIAGYGVAGFVFSSVLSAALVATLGFLAIRTEVPLRAALATDIGDSRRELFSFNGLNVVLVLLLLSLFHVDVVMVRLLTGDGATGHYRAALALAEYLWFVPLALQTLLLHSASELWSDDRTDRITDIAGRVTRYVLLLTVLMAIGIAVLADRFVTLYFGAGFAPTVAPLLVLLPGVVGFALARPLFAINQGTGSLRPVILATGGSALLNVGLNAVLIPRFGIVGAAAATSAGYGSMFGLQVVCARWFGYDPLVDLRLPRALVTIGLGGAAIVAIEATIGNDLLALVLVPPLGAAIYASVAVKTGAIDATELHLLTGALPSTIAGPLQWLIPD